MNDLLEQLREEKKKKVIFVKAFFPDVFCVKRLY